VDEENNHKKKTGDLNGCFVSTKDVKHGFIIMIGGGVITLPLFAFSGSQVSPRELAVLLGQC
jgi:hypothetical protein